MGNKIFWNLLEQMNKIEICWHTHLLLYFLFLFLQNLLSLCFMMTMTWAGKSSIT